MNQSENPILPEMTLMDYFAAQIFPHYDFRVTYQEASNTSYYDHLKKKAEMAYDAADALLKARERYVR